MHKIASLELTGLRSYLFKRIMIRYVGHSLAGRPSNTRSVLGNKVTFDDHDIEQRYFLENCVREPENIFLYNALAASGLCSTFVDVGANFGQVASEVFPSYDRLLLVEANPKAAAFLSGLFNGHDKVQIKNVALVDSDLVKQVTLLVPDNSSGTATIQADSSASVKGAAYQCQAATLDRVICEAGDPMYIKIDVEGVEEQVLRGGLQKIKSLDSIIGFEALSKEVAVRCCALFTAHDFYFARFDFMNRSGALTKSWAGVAGALLLGGNIGVYKFAHIDEVELDNFTQIIAVPRGLSSKFETAIGTYLDRTGGKVKL